jgi:hypothetical protein
LVKVGRHSLRGKWSFEGPVLVVQRGAVQLVSPEIAQGCLQIPFTPPDEYVLEAVAERRSGNNALMFGIVAGGRQCAVAVDSNFGQPFAGLELVDGLQHNENETAVLGKLVAEGDSVPIVVTVRKGHITATCAGRLIVDWSGDCNRLSVHPPYRIVPENSLFVVAYGSRFKISKLTLRTISGCGHVAEKAGRE